MGYIKVGSRTGTWHLFVAGRVRHRRCVALLRTPCVCVPHATIWFMFGERLITKGAHTHEHMRTRTLRAGFCRPDGGL